MISISRTIADTNGNVILPYVDDPRGGTARMTRTATLDVGAVINILGVADGDRTIPIRNLPVNEDIAETALYLYSLAEKVLITIKDGVFLGAIKTCKPNNGLLNMTLLIESKESA